MDPQTNPITALLSIKIPSGQELYDQLMREIDPDLVTAELPLLKQKYAGESAEQAAAREERYRESFAEYDRRLSAYLGELQGRVHGYQHAAMQSIEEHDRESDRTALQNLEANFSS